MRWWGKAAGAVLGGLAGGPAGAFIGSAIGHAVDANVLEFGWFDLQRAQQTFFEQTFAVMGFIAKSDGRVSEREIAVAEMIMQQMQMGRERRRLAIRQYNQGKAAGFDIDLAIAAVKRDCGAHPEMLRLFLEYLIESAAADGQVARPALQALFRISGQLGIAQVEVQQMLGRRTQRSGGGVSSGDPYAALGLSSSANRQEVKRAYRKLMSRHHPDKLVAKGLPKEMLELAKDKTAAITAAYETIKTQRGW